MSDRTRSQLALILAAAAFLCSNVSLTLNAITLRKLKRIEQPVIIHMNVEPYFVPVVPQTRSKEGRTDS